MITYTNNLDLPAPIFHLITKGDKEYTGNAADYSVTKLIDTPRRVQLMKRHDFEIDISDLWASWVGKVMHRECERFNTPYSIYEHRMTIPLEYRDQVRTLSGQIDAYDFQTKTLVDVKTGREASIYGYDHEAWEPQLNLYSWMLGLHNLDCLNAFVRRIAIDWRPGSYTSFSKVPADDLPIKLWSAFDKFDYAYTRFVDHLLAEQETDEELPACSKEDMWEKDPVWKVKKAGQKRSLKNCSSEEEAKEYIGNHKNKDKLTIEMFPGVRTRCERFCICNGKCDIFQEYLSGKGETPSEDLSDDAMQLSD